MVESKNPNIIIGVKGIAAFYNCSPRTVLRRLPDMKKSGVIFRRWFGKPPIRAWSGYREKLLEFAPIFWEKEKGG